MQDLTVKPHFELKVGCPDKNHVSFEIAATKDMKKLGVNIVIPCGKATSDKTYLSADGKRARLTPRSEPADKLTFLAQQPTEKNVSWKSSTFSLKEGEKVTIIIAGFNPERDGNASLHLKIGNPNPLHNEPYTVSIAPASGVAIIYFDVSPTNVLQHGEVTISSTTTGAKTVKLYAGENLVEHATLVADQTVTVRKIHAPQSSTTYRLKAWQEKEGSDDEADARAGRFAKRELAVAVAPRPGWYSWDLLRNSLAGANAGQSFYPTLLLAAKDLSEETDGDVLYGVFVCNETKEAGLWSSTSGFDDWSFLGKVPEGMGDCPGVIHNKALWLIGGSSADPEGPVSNRVCWYYKNKENEMVWKEWDEDGSVRKDPARAPAPRKCHACAVFDDKVWVLGGLSGQNIELADVWTCSADPTSGNFTATWKQSKPLPSGRCMLAVAATPARTNIAGLKKPRLWLYGGATHPYNYKNPFDKLLWTEKGEVWVDSQDPFGVKLPEKEGAPLGATLLYGSDKHLHLLGRFQRSGGGLSMSVHDLQDLTSRQTGWGNEPVVDIGWHFSMAELFLIRSVSFRERWIFWPVFQKMDRKKKYPARIYNAPLTT